MRLKSDAYRDYVERVFRLQSEVSTDLLFALDEADPDNDRYTVLENAELAVTTACLGINELAAEQQSGQRPGGVAALQRARTVPECERAARAGARLLGD